METFTGSEVDVGGSSIGPCGRQRAVSRPRRAEFSSRGGRSAGTGRPSPAPVAESALVSASAQVSDALPTAGTAAATAPEGVPHLPSPDNLPPEPPRQSREHRRLGYLREIWQAVRSEDVTMGDALLLIAQRPLDSVPKGMTPQQGAPKLPLRSLPRAQCPVNGGRVVAGGRVVTGGRGHRSPRLRFFSRFGYSDPRLTTTSLRRRNESSTAGRRTMPAGRRRFQELARSVVSNSLARGDRGGAGDSGEAENRHSLRGDADQSHPVILGGGQ